MKNYVEFTKAMKKDYTLLIPTMLPMHFKLIISVLRTYGYKAELLETSGPKIAETGLRYVHNDTCYPAILVIGQFMDALESGKYDPHKTALVLFQSGGGCRASNYISLLRKSLANAGMDYVPVIPFGIAGLEKHSGFSLDFKKLHSMMYGLLYADLIMSLVNQCRPYEIHKGEAQALADKWIDKLGDELGSKKRIDYRRIKRNYIEIAESFAKIERKLRPAVHVGIVGEIFVKYSPLGNNNLEQFLVDEGAETVVPWLFDFCLYTVCNIINDYKLYKRGNPAVYYIYKWLYKFICNKKNDVSEVIKNTGIFKPFASFEDTVKLIEGYIGSGVKMGEGWLLTAEMLELEHMGVKNIVCTQPFGCLPNHICGKGMMKIIKDKNPDVNIVAIDYDAGSTQVNQINRLKLMLANAAESTNQQRLTKKSATTNN